MKKYVVMGLVFFGMLCIVGLGFLYKKSIKIDNKGFDKSIEPFYIEKPLDSMLGVTKVDVSNSKALDRLEVSGMVVEVSSDDGVWYLKMRVYMGSDLKSGKEKIILVRLGEEGDIVAVYKAKKGIVESRQEWIGTRVKDLVGMIKPERPVSLTVLFDDRTIEQIWGNECNVSCIRIYDLVKNYYKNNEMLLLYSEGKIVDIESDLVIGPLGGMKIYVE